MRYLEPSRPLVPADAAVGLITDEAGEYLLQLRDSNADIFFPDHWGCFGGALEPGENHEQALARELMEELNLDISKCAVKKFTRYTFDFTSVGYYEIDRVFYDIVMPPALKLELKLGEGQKMAFLDSDSLLKAKMVPYDQFAIWMHVYRDKISDA